MTVNKITNPPSQKGVIDKVNEIIDDFTLDELANVSISSPTAGQNLTYDATNQVWKNTSTTATVAWGGITGTLADQTDLKNALNGKLDGYNLSVAGQWTGGVHPVNFLTVNYTECNSENGVFIKLSMVNSHGNGITGRFFQDVILNCNYTGTVAGTLYRYFAENIDISSSEYYGVRKFGDIFWTIDTTNKIVKFYVLMRQYSYTYMTPYFRLNVSTKGVITQHTGIGAEEYSSGTQTWATVNWFETDQVYSATSSKPQSGVAIAGAGFLKSSDVTEYTANEVETLWNSI